MIKEFLNIIIDWSLMMLPFAVIGLTATYVTLRVFREKINKFFA